MFGGDFEAFLDLFCCLLPDDCIEDGDVSNTSSESCVPSDSVMSSIELLGLRISAYNALVVIVVGTTPSVSFSPVDSELSRGEL